MTYQQCLDIYGISDILSLPEAALRVVLGPEKTRHKVFRALLEANDFEMGRDWFQGIFEAEMSEGKRKGQHFTPPEVNMLVSELVGCLSGSVHEPTAGIGGLIIADWWRRCLAVNPWRWRPSEHQYTAWELSERAVPLLLTNLAVRGIVGDVYHGDVLEQTVKCHYRLVNPTNDGLAFSSVIIIED